jgi:hypothetical protein
MQLRVPRQKLFKARHSDENESEFAFVENGEQLLEEKRPGDACGESSGIMNLHMLSHGLVYPDEFLLIVLRSGLWSN